MVKKITTGFVVQQFDDDGKFQGQTFVAGDQVEYEDENGDSIDPEVECYYPMEMKQTLK